MRYVSALSFAVAIAAHSGALLNTLMLAGLITIGVLAALFAIESMIADAVDDLDPRPLTERTTYDGLEVRPNPLRRRRRPF